MGSMLRTTLLLSLMVTLTACGVPQGAYHAPGELVPTDQFVMNVLREQGVVTTVGAPQ